jgi:ABC-type Fe3+/spermidine/putrescine transport system ATPase subunit
MTQAVAFEKVTKRFDTTTAVDGIDLDIADGEFFAMLGPQDPARPPASEQ